MNMQTQAVGVPRRTSSRNSRQVRGQQKRGNKAAAGQNGSSSSLRPDRSRSIRARSRSRSSRASRSHRQTSTHRNIGSVSYVLPEKMGQKNVEQRLTVEENDLDYFFVEEQEIWYYTANTTEEGQEEEDTTD